MLVKWWEGLRVVTSAFAVMTYQGLKVSDGFVFCFFPDMRINDADCWVDEAGHL